MLFQIKNETGAAITLRGTTYNNGDMVNIVPFIGYQGLTVTRNDVDGPNAGRALNGLMIRDRVATKLKWEVTLLATIREDEARAIYNLVFPETFHITTDFPTGASKTYTVYSNNVPLQFCLNTDRGTAYYTGVQIPIVEV